MVLRFFNCYKSLHCFYFPDLSSEEMVFEENLLHGFDLLKKIPGSVGRSIIALEIDGRIQDLCVALPPRGIIRLVSSHQPEGLEILRHTGAHVLAQAVLRLFPQAQMTIGPVIENGFYYDFFQGTPFSEHDLSAIEQEMHVIVKEDLKVFRHEWTKEKALAFFHERGQFFKERIIHDLPDHEPISIYQQGDFYDLCRGPHLPSTRYLGKAFQLNKISGAYWRGDSANEQLQRIYGLAFETKEQLETYLWQKEQAEKNDHRVLSQEMNLFHFQEEAPGCVFWHPKGWTIYQTLKNYVRERMKESGYQEIHTPSLVSRSLWEKSGHWEKFRQNMFCLEHEKNFYALKPMNCPCHIQVFNQGLKSYKDLPIRLSEFGSCMRDEPSGALSGLMRLRHFVQDDAHIFCLPEQMVEETQTFCRLLFDIYKDLGFEDVLVRFSSRPAVRLGDDVLWDAAEKALCEGADAAGLVYEEFKGEGAFYGPKLEFVLKDRLGRLWQCGTLQVDFVLPQRLGAYYVDSCGTKKHPAMLHRAILGSIERFMGILLEHYGGHLPLWLAPVQAVVSPISEKHADYAKKVQERLKFLGIRVILDVRNEKIGYKIREHNIKKIPYILVVGAKEEETETVSVRTRHEQDVMSVDSCLEMLQDRIRTHG
jgi:threonyl-tRNA synthetase